MRGRGQIEQRPENSYQDGRTDKLLDDSVISNIGKRRGQKGKRWENYVPEKILRNLKITERKMILSKRKPRKIAREGSQGSIKFIKYLL